MRAPIESKRRARFGFIAAAFLISLAALAGCGGGGSGTVTPPVAPPPTSGTGITVYPGTTTVPLGGKATFTAYAASSPSTTSFTWAVTGGSANGTITTDASGHGDYVAPTTAPSGAVTVTATTGSLGGSATVTITAAAAGGVAVSPASVALPAGGAAVQFTATVNGAAATVTQWEVNGTAGGDSQHGTIDNNGNYTAPLMPPPGGSATITAMTGSGSASSTVTVLFSNSSFSGSYAFSYTGVDVTGYLAVAGSFTAQTGTLTGGEDATDLGGTASDSISGTYTIGPDGRGTVTIAGGPNDGETWQIALGANPSADIGDPAQHAILIRFDANGAGSGSLDQQNTIEAQTPFPVGNYAFGLTGIDSAASQVVAAGKFASTGNGGTTANASVWDVNFAGTPITDDTTLTATFTASSGFSGSVGRGIMTLFSTNGSLETLTGAVAPASSTFQFFFYVVDSTHIKVVENDGHAFLSGDVYSGPTTPDGSFTAANALRVGNYAFTVSGASTLGPYVAGGVFGANAGAQTTAGVMDINNNGVQIPLDKTLSTLYNVDTSLGRISFTFTPAGSGSYTFDGFATSGGAVELVETDNLAVAGGVAFPQTATTEPTGSFGFNISGVAISKSEGEEDASGQMSIANGTVTGTLDLNNAAVTGAVDPGLELQTGGTTITAPDANGRGTLTIATSVTTYPLAYYMVNSKTALLLGTNGSHVALGTMNGQN